MKHRVGLGLSMAICVVAEAAEPGASSKSAPVAAPVTSSASQTTAPAPPDKPATRKPLNLSIGSVRSYMMPSEFAQAVNAPGADENTVVVEGRRALLPMESEQPVPGGLIAPFWALANPLNAWRIFAPVVSGPDKPRQPEDKVPAREFRWGP